MLLEVAMVTKDPWEWEATLPPCIPLPAQRGSCSGCTGGCPDGASLTLISSPVPHRLLAVLWPSALFLDPPPDLPSSSECS